VSQPEPLLVLGTREFAVEIADLATESGQYRVEGFVENESRERCRGTLEGLPIVWVDDLAEHAATHRAVCALGTTFRSRFVAQAAAHGLQFATIVHPDARISGLSTVGAGSILGAGVVVGARSRIGEHVLLNRGCLVGHHTAVGDYCSLLPGANVAGLSRLGEAVFVGMGAAIANRVSVGDHSVVGAGAVVLEDVPDHVQVVGVPARVVREGIEGR
jgi:acetyltransferase EpsM